MRRFSKRNQLVTLSDLNVTPMLDLAFVLLIIFVIATPLLEQGMKLELPDGGAADTAVKRDDVRTVEVSRQGQYLLNRKPMSLGQLIQLVLSFLRRRFGRSWSVNATSATARRRR